MLRGMGVPVHDADAAVHKLLGPGGKALAKVGAAFPGVVGPAGVDRLKLGAIVFNDAAALKRLEAILHPMVRADERRFLGEMRRRRADVVVLDIPLLYETGGDRRCDAVIVVTAPAFLQRARVLGRKGMTEEKLRAILAKQVPDAVKRTRADFLVDTGDGRATTLRRLAGVLRAVRASPSRRRRRSQPLPTRCFT
jgi:dephospho-CoA kinase